MAFAGEEGGDALATEDAQFDGAGRHRFDADRIEAAVGAQNAKAGTPRRPRTAVPPPSSTTPTCADPATGEQRPRSQAGSFPRCRNPRLERTPVRRFERLALRLTQDAQRLFVEPAERADLDPI